VTAEELTPLLGLALSVGLAYACTPIAIRAAHRLEFYDHPVGYKEHGQPTPYLGGAAVVAAFIAVLLLLGTDSRRAFPLLAGVGILWAVGTIDDRRTVSPALRVALEAVLAAGLWGLGYGWDFGVGAGVDLLVTVLWIVGVVNAFNLFDNMDGAAGSMAAVAAGAIAVVGVVTGDQWLAVASAALAGACLGFLPYNLASPAKIFLGDGGSMPAGFGVAALAMMGASATAPSWQALAIGVLLVGVPALDTALVVVSRFRRGIPLATGGRDHLTHRAREHLQTVRAVALALGASQVVLGVLAVLATRGGSALLAGAMFAYLVGVGATIFVLDGRPGAPGRYGLSREPVLLSTDEARIEQAHVRRGSGEAGITWDAVIAGGVGCLAGLSPFVDGLYGASRWAPVGIVAVVACVAAFMGARFRLSRAAALLFGSIAALALFTLVSATWAPSTERAIADANRIFLYLALLGVLLVTVRDRAAAAAGLAGLMVGGACVAGYIAIALATGSGGDLFLGDRLHEPLGYINGQGTVLLLTLFTALGLVEQRRSAALAGAAAAIATLAAGLALLTVSRGTALAAFLGLAVLLAFVPGRMWRAAGFAVIAGGVAAAAPSLLDVSEATQAAVVGARAQSASQLLLVVSLIVGLAWAGAVSLRGRARPRTQQRALRAWRVALAVGAVALVPVAASNTGGLIDGVETQYDAFVMLEGSEADTSGTRLLSGAGNRYDYWRIAVEAWKSQPVRGVGAGGYQVAYFRERTTSEDIRQPHSLELQALADLGLVGLLLLGVAALAVAAGAVSRIRGATTVALERPLLVAALGSAVAWGVHASVDWPHLLPGVTAGALVAISALMRPPAGLPPRSHAPRWPLVRRTALVVGVSATLAIGGFSLSRQVLVDRYRSAAEDALADGQPAEALEQAGRALRLAPDDLEALYARAAAHARFNDPAAAKGALQEAIRHEPSNFVSYVLLGDLEVRLGRYAAAREAYRAARALNPRDPEIAQLAADPRSALDSVDP
jgi:UDP-GlcNAc:undecaprenyl-phosphate GlcNAc-1-phosphate transferase